jgi:pyruvate/2-oxoglutarate dehydrogenase complex dihydrolipoamide dehydrogenase (E3) component
MVSVGERRLTAPEIFINTGCRPTIPAIGGLGIEYLTSTGMMGSTLPAHLIIIGGSYVGLNSRKCTGALEAKLRSSKWPGG